MFTIISILVGILVGAGSAAYGFPNGWSLLKTMMVAFTIITIFHITVYLTVPHVYLT